MIIFFKFVNAIQTIYTSMLLAKPDCTTKLVKLKKILDHNYDNR